MCKYQRKVKSTGFLVPKPMVCSSKLHYGACAVLLCMKQCSTLNRRSVHDIALAVVFAFLNSTAPAPCRLLRQPNGVPADHRRFGIAEALLLKEGMVGADFGKQRNAAQTK